MLSYFAFHNSPWRWASSPPSCMEESCGEVNKWPQVGGYGGFVPDSHHMLNLLVNERSCIWQALQDFPVSLHPHLLQLLLVPCWWMVLGFSAGGLPWLVEASCCLMTKGPVAAWDWRSSLLACFSVYLHSVLCFITLDASLCLVSPASWSLCPSSVLPSLTA